MSNGRLLGYSFLVMLTALPLTSALGQQVVAAEIISKRYSSGYFPVPGSYVEYEFRLTNTGDAALEDRSLQVSLVSEGNMMHSYATYSIPPLEPGGSKTYFIGPFKIEGEGNHRLLATIDGEELDYRPDSFMVYRQDAIQAALFGIPLVIAGAAIVGFSLYRKKRRTVV